MKKQLTQLDINELSDLSVLIDDDLLEMAELIFPDQPEGYIEVTKQIGDWAITQKTVQEFLASDNQQIAFIFDKMCYRIWQDLPTYAQRLTIDLSNKKLKTC